MVVLYAFFALLAGFVTMAVLVAVMTLVLKKLTPSWTGTPEKPGVGYTFVNLGCSFLAAAAGGYVTASLSQNNPLVHVLALAITVLLLAALSVPQKRGRQPVWFLLLLVALTPLGALAGGLVRLRMQGIL